MKILKIVFPLLIFVIIFGSLIDDCYAVPKKLVGMWRAIGTCEFISIQFRDDATFTADRGMDRLYSNLEGTYRVYKRTITLTVANDPRMNPVANTIKLRSYKVKNDILTFTINGKKCKFERTG